MYACGYVGSVALGVDIVYGWQSVPVDRSVPVSGSLFMGVGVCFCGVVCAVERGSVTPFLRLYLEY